MDEDRAEQRSDHVGVRPRGQGEEVAGEVDPAALMRRFLEALRERGDEPGVLIGDHELHAAQPALFQRAQEAAPEHLVLAVADVAAEDLPVAARREIRRLERDLDRLLDEHGTTLRDEPGIGPIAAATLIAEVGDPFRFARESKFARWSGTGAVALSSAEGGGPPLKHRLDFGGNRRINSVLYIASVTQQRSHHDARAYIDRKISEGKTRREARRAHKRHLATRVIRRMWKDESRRRERPTITAA